VVIGWDWDGVCRIRYARNARYRARARYGARIVGKAAAGAVLVLNDHGNGESRRGPAADGSRRRLRLIFGVPQVRPLYRVSGLPMDVLRRPRRLYGGRSRGCRHIGRRRSVSDGPYFSDEGGGGVGLGNDCFIAVIVQIYHHLWITVVVYTLRFCLHLLQSENYLCRVGAYLDADFLNQLVVPGKAAQNDAAADLIHAGGRVRAHRIAGYKTGGAFPHRAQIGIERIAGVVHKRVQGSAAVGGAGAKAGFYVARFDRHVFSADVVQAAPLDVLADFLSRRGGIVQGLLFECGGAVAAGYTLFRVRVQIV